MFLTLIYRSRYDRYAVLNRITARQLQSIEQAEEFHVDGDAFERASLGYFRESHWSRVIGQRSATSLSLERTRTQTNGAGFDDEDIDGRENIVIKATPAGLYIHRHTYSHMSRIPRASY